MIINPLTTKVDTTASLQSKVYRDMLLALLLPDLCFNFSGSYVKRESIKGLYSVCLRRHFGTAISWYNNVPYATAKNAKALQAFSSKLVFSSTNWSLFLPRVLVKTNPTIHTMLVLQTSARDLEMGLITLETVKAMPTDSAIENISPMQR